MSIKFLNMAFDLEIKPSSLKFVLVALADYANEAGEAYPSIQTLTNKTCQDRKTVQANLKKLQEKGMIVDTGERKGRTGQIPVFELVFNDPENGTLKGSQKRERSQKRNSTENGMGKSTKNGTLKGSQKRDTEPSVSFNHQLEPSDTKISVKPKNTKSQKIRIEQYALGQSMGLSREFIDSILQKRRDINKPASTVFMLKLILNGMSETVELGYLEDMQACLDLYMKKTWQGFSPEWVNEVSRINRVTQTASNVEEFVELIGAGNG